MFIVTCLAVLGVLVEAQTFSKRDINTASSGRQPWVTQVRSSTFFLGDMYVDTVFASIQDHNEIEAGPAGNGTMVYFPPCTVDCKAQFNSTINGTSITPTWESTWNVGPGPLIHYNP
jgi:hypothetical protein